MHAAFEVAVARKHARNAQIAFLDRCFDFFGQRSAVTDAGSAAVADGVEADGIEIFGELRSIEVFGDNLAAGSKARLHPGLAGEAKGPRLACHQARGDEHIRIAGVRARRDRRDHHRAVADLARSAIGVLDGARGTQDLVRGHAKAAVAHRGSHRLEELLLDVLEFDAILRALGASEAGLNGREIKLERVGELGVGRTGLPPEHVGLAVLLDQFNCLGIAAGELEIVERHLIDGEEADSRAVFGGHVRDGGAVGHAQCRDAVAEELDELVDDALLAEDLRDGEHEVGGGRAFGELALELEADDIGREHVDRLAEHHGLGLDATNTPANNTKTVDHRGVAVGADARIGIRRRLAVGFLRPDRASEILKVHLMHDARGRRHRAEVRERLLAPLEELIALVVAFELLLRVDREGGLAREGIHLHAVVNHQVAGNQRVDRVGIAAELLHRIAHRGKIHHARHTREVLKDDTRRHKGNFFLDRCLGVPVGQT